jgi:uncharacterized protein (TIGR02996 family)
MGHLDPFVRAVLDSPDDDNPRLVCADWLDERGDPRGEFIRVQCERAALPADDDRVGPLEAREFELLERHAADWFGANVRLLQGERGVWVEPAWPLRGFWQFERGFLERGALPAGRLLRQPDALDRLAPTVRRLQLQCFYDPHRDTPIPRPDDGDPAASVEELLGWDRLARLCELEVDCWSVGDTFVQRLTESPRLSGLSTLRLPNRQLGSIAARALAESPHLAGLSVLDLRFAKEGQGDSTLIGDAGARALARSPYLAGLTALDVPFCHLGPDGLRALLESSRLPRLAALDLHDNEELGRAGLQLLANSPSAGRLTRLDLGGLTTTPQSLRVLADSPHLTGLTELNLRSHMVPSGLDAGVLASARWLPQLTRLDLTGGRLGDRGLAALTGSGSLGRLRGLGLAGNRIGDAGARTLADCPDLAGLTELSLGNNPIGDAGLRALAATLHLKRLRKLGLAGPPGVCDPLADDAMQSLADSALAAGLTELDLRWRPFGVGAARSLAESENLARLTRLRCDSRCLKAEVRATLRERFGQRLDLGGRG